MIKVSNSGTVTIRAAIMVSPHSDPLSACNPKKVIATGRILLSGDLVISIGQKKAFHWNTQVIMEKDRIYGLIRGIPTCSMYLKSVHPSILALSINEEGSCLKACLNMKIACAETT